MLGTALIIVIFGMVANLSPNRAESSTSVTLKQLPYPYSQPTTPSINLLYTNTYHNYTQLVEEINHINNAAPDLVEVEAIGESWYNRTIYALRLTNELNMGLGEKAETYFVAQHHAREEITVEVTLRFILTLLNNYRKNDTITQLLDSTAVYFIPTLNPDGLDQIFIDHFQRKNARFIDEDGDGLDGEDPLDSDGDGIEDNIDDDGDGRINEDPLGGVDLNRNYDFHFADPTVDSGATSDVRSQDYPGPAPFSEPETQAMKKFVESHHFVHALSYHSGTNATIFPWGYTNELAPDSSLFARISGDIGRYLPYEYTTEGAASYTVAGEWGDWNYGVHGIIPMTIEVYGGSPFSRGLFDFFNPPKEKIDALHEMLIEFEIYWSLLTPRLQFTSIFNEQSFIDKMTTGNQATLALGIENLSPRLNTSSDVSVEIVNKTIDGLRVSTVESNNVGILKPKDNASTLTKSKLVAYTITAEKDGTYRLIFKATSKKAGTTYTIIELTISRESPEKKVDVDFTWALIALPMSLFILYLRKKKILSPKKRKN